MEHNDMVMTNWCNVLRLLVAIADQSSDSSDCEPFLAFLKPEKLSTKYIFYSFMTHSIICYLKSSELNSTGINPQFALA